MATSVRLPVDQHKDTIPQMLNDSFDRTFRNLTTEILGYDGNNLTRIKTDENGVLTAGAVNYAYKITESGTDTYVAIAEVGSAQADAVWQVMKIDQATGVVITWADGDDDFDNVATDLTALSYS